MTNFPCKTLDILKLLLAHGADLRATANDGTSALTIATEHNHSAGR